MAGLLPDAPLGSGGRLKAQLIERDDEHHWVLLDHRVTQLVFDEGALALQTWSLDGSANVRLGAPFTLRSAGGGERSLDPADTEGMSPTLGLLRRELRSLTVTRAGVLAVGFRDGAEIIVTPHPRLEAWQVQGAGVLEGMSYRCPPGGGVPWA